MGQYGDGGCREEKAIKSSKKRAAAWKRQPLGGGGGVGLKVKKE